MKKRMLSVLVVLFVLFCVMPSCFAERKTQDGLEVVLTTDKTEYQRNEAITATLKVTNTNEHAVSNVSLENVVIDGYAIVEGSQGTQEFESIQPQESVSLETTLKEAGQKGSEAVKTGIENDPEKIMIAVGLLLLCVALLYYLAKNHKGKRVFSILLGFVIVGSGMMMMSDSPSAAEALSKIEVSTTITVEQREVELKGAVSYRGTDRATKNEETLTIGDILPDDFPCTDIWWSLPENAWKAENGNLCYKINDDTLCFYYNNPPQTHGYGMGNPVTESGGNYTYNELTFIMSGDKLERIEVNGDGNFDGVYAPPPDPPKKSTIRDVLPEGFPCTNDGRFPPENAWKAENGNLCYRVKGDEILCIYHPTDAGFISAGYSLDNPVTESEGNYYWDSMIFVMSGDKLVRIEKPDVNMYSGIYTPPENKSVEPVPDGMHGIDVLPTSLELEVGETKTFTLKISSEGISMPVELSFPDCVYTDFPTFIGLFWDQPVEVSITGVVPGTGEIRIQPDNPFFDLEVLPVTVTEAKGGENAKN